MKVFKDYDVIGIGALTCGMKEIWKYRLNLLKDAILTSDKNIDVYHTISYYQANNIMNKTYYDQNVQEYINIQEITIDISNNFGPFIIRSDIYLDIVKFINEHKDRITIKSIQNMNIDKTKINFVWAHNKMIDDRQDTLGSYLNNNYNYCIVLSQAYKGEIRVVYQGTYDYMNFTIPVLENYDEGLLTEFNDELYEFSNRKCKNMIQKIRSNSWTYILFYKKITALRDISLETILYDILGKEHITDDMIDIFQTELEGKTYDEMKVIINKNISPDLITNLKQAYTDELLAEIQYTQGAEDIIIDEIKEEFLIHAKEEKQHAKEILSFIPDGYKSDMKGDYTDPRGKSMENKIHDNIEAEFGAIIFYTRILSQIENNKKLYEKITEIRNKEVEHYIDLIEMLE